jgi:hypothetical protein
MTTIDWVREVLIVWGLQRRRIEAGGVPYECEGEPRWHEDGWPPRSIQGKSKDEGEGASHTADGQHYPEALTGDALNVSRALCGAPEPLRKIAREHYVVPKSAAPVKEKMHRLGYGDKKAYYADLGKLHIWIAARWDVPHGTKRGDTVPTNYQLQT